MATKTITDTDQKLHSYDVPPWRYYSTTPHRNGALIALENTETGKTVVHQVDGTGEFEKRTFTW